MVSKQRRQKLAERLADISTLLSALQDKTYDELPSGLIKEKADIEKELGI